MCNFITLSAHDVSSCSYMIIMIYLSLFYSATIIFFTLKIYDGTNLLSVDINTQRTILNNRKLE